MSGPDDPSNDGDQYLLDGNRILFPTHLNESPDDEGWTDDESDDNKTDDNESDDNESTTTKWTMTNRTTIN